MFLTCYHLDKSRSYWIECMRGFICGDRFHGLLSFRDVVRQSGRGCPDVLVWVEL